MEYVMGFRFKGQLIAVREDVNRSTGLLSGYTSIAVLSDEAMDVQRFYAKNGECSGLSAVAAGQLVSVECGVYPKPPEGARPASLSCKAFAIASAEG